MQEEILDVFKERMKELEKTNDALRNRIQFLEKQNESMQTQLSSIFDTLIHKVSSSKNGS